jgi:transcriptional regulator with XRE-family HTH domain
MEHERFLREIRSLPLGNQEIAQRMGTDDTRISHYRNGKKWPSRRTLNIFNHEFRHDLDAMEDEKRKKEEPFQYYLTNPISVIKHHMVWIENSISAIRTAIEDLETKQDVDAGKK